VIAALSVVLAVSPVAWRALPVENGFVVLHRFRAESPAHPPVVLVADFGFGRRLLEPLARFLAVQGHMTYVAEVAGQGRSSPAHTLAQAQRHLLDAVAHVQKEERAPVDVVFHGWLGTLGLAGLADAPHLFVRRVVLGGLVAYAYLSQGGQGLHAVVTLGSPTNLNWGTPLLDVARVVGPLI
jgi:predicted alpha/beta hydrolase